MMGIRYSRCPHVIGYDLRNEIRPRWGLWPSWGRGASFKALWGVRRDWASAAVTVANCLLEAQPEALIIVERIVWPQQPIQAYVKHLLPKIKPGKLVLGVHVYSWSGPGRFIPRWSVSGRVEWFVDKLRTIGLVTKHNYGEMGKERLRDQVDCEWGSVLKDNLCPVWVSEFGADLSNRQEMSWLEDFIEILKECDADWAYWPLNVGYKPGTDAVEAYGMLSESWEPAEDARVSQLRAVGLEPPKALRRDSKTAITMPASCEDLQKLYGGKNPLLGVTVLPSLPQLSDFGHRLTHLRSRPRAESGMRKGLSVPADLSASGGPDSGGSGLLKRPKEDRGSCPASLSSMGGAPDEAPDEAPVGG